jgi:hypothetical protein
MVTGVGREGRVWVRAVYEVAIVGLRYIWRQRIEQDTYGVWDLDTLDKAMHMAWLEWGA